MLIYCSIVAHTVPLRQRALFTGAISAMEGIGFILGPLVGGVLTSRASWRWCFWINLPVGAITSFVIGIFLKPPRIRTAPRSSLQQRLRQFDWFGTLAFVPSILCLLLALQWGGSKYAWNNARIIVVFILFGVLFISFALIQKYLPNTATIPGRVAKSRSMVFGALFAFSLPSALVIMSYFLPLCIQGIKNASALQSGVMLLPRDHWYDHWIHLRRFRRHRNWLLSTPDGRKWHHNAHRSGLADSLLRQYATFCLD